jgi:hypothetical protein
MLQYALKRKGFSAIEFPALKDESPTPEQQFYTGIVIGLQQTQLPNPLRAWRNYAKIAISPSTLPRLSI